MSSAGRMRFVKSINNERFYKFYVFYFSLKFDTYYKDSNY